MKSPLHILRRLWQRGSDRRRRARFDASLRHVSGPRTLDLGRDDVLAIVLVRDGGYYLDAFLEHYRAMGVRHFAFIDNGSGDDTLDRLADEPGVAVDQSTLPLASYEDLLRGHPARTYGQDRWCLYVDMDEQLDFEGRNTHGIKALTGYLQAMGHTALVAQMLEMFPKATLAQVADMSFERALRDFIYYDISTVDRSDYHSTDIPFSDLLAHNHVTDPAIKFCFGGVRGKVFGEACCLTKHPLVFNGPGVTPAPHPHLSTGVICSDATAVIRHYKFANDPLARDLTTTQSGAVDHGEDAARMSVMRQDPDLTLFSLDARRWNKVQSLYRAGFLNPSARYSAWLAEQDA